MLLVPPDLDRRTGPDRRTAMRSLLVRALAPGIVLWLAIAGFGLLLTGPLQGLGPLRERPEQVASGHA